MSAPRPDTDMLVIGAGPAGLAAAIALRRAAPALRVMVLEKAPAVGRHLMSGAIVDPAPLRRLLPPADFATLPLGPAVARATYHLLLPRRGSVRVPYVPPPMRNAGLSFANLPDLARALARLAEAQGATLLAAQPADALVFADAAEKSQDLQPVVGVRTGGDLLTARHVLIAEGSGGPLAAAAREHYPSLRPLEPPSHAIAFRQTYRLSQASAGRFEPRAWHTFGAPLPTRTYGGGFLYRLAPDRIAAGLVVALDAPMPPAPFSLFQQWLHHPFVAALLRDAEPESYGARLIPEGGWPAIPPFLQAANVTLLGDAASLLDPFALKGIHLGIEAAQAAAERLAAAAADLSGNAAEVPLCPPDPLRRSDLPFAARLRTYRNYRPAFARGLVPGVMGTGLAFLTRGCLPPGQGHLPGDLPSAHRPDTPSLPSHHAALEAALARSGLAPPPPGAPSHIQVLDPGKCHGCPHPCLHFCPSATYAPVPAPAEPLAAPPLLHPENCLHCHTCLLRCPRANLRWAPPAPPAGPSYP